MDDDANELNRRSSQYEEGPTTSLTNKDDPKRFVFLKDEVEECECFDSEEECDCVADANTGEKCQCHNKVHETDDLEWIPYLRLIAYQFAKILIFGLIFVGGGLARFFGINTQTTIVGAMKNIAMVDVDKLQIVGERNKLRRRQAAMLLTDVEMNIV